MKLTTSSTTIFTLVLTLTFLSFAHPTMAQEDSAPTATSVSFKEKVKRKWNSFVDKANDKLWQAIIKQTFKSGAEKTSFLQPKAVTEYYTPVRPLEDKDLQGVGSSTLPNKTLAEAEEWARSNPNDPQSGLTAIKTKDWVPEQDISQKEERLIKIITYLYKKFSPNYRKRDLIPDNAAEFSKIYPQAFTKLLPAPQAPQEVLKNLDDYMAILTTKGPFAEFLRKVPGKDGQDGFVIDMQALKDYQSQPGLQNLACSSTYRYDSVLERMVGETITYIGENGESTVSHKGDANWKYAQKVLACALSTYITVIDHLLHTHLIIAQNFTDAQLEFGDHHPIRNILEPFGKITKAINKKIGNLISDENASVPQAFTYSHQETKRLMNDIALNKFQISAMDPRVNAIERGVLDKDGKTFMKGSDGKPIKYPFLDQVLKLFDIFVKNSKNYLSTYYHSDAEISRDLQVQAWYQYLDQTIPGGIKKYAPEITIESVAKLMSLHMFNATVRHESVGNNTWKIFTQHYIVPSRLVLENPCGLQSQDTTVRYMNSSLLTMVPLAQLKDLPINLVIPESKGRKVLYQMFSDLSDYDAQLEEQGVDWSDLLFKNFETSVSI